MNRPARFRQRDLDRAIRSVKNAGLTIGGVEIDENGKITVKCAAETPPPASDSFDAWKAKRASAHERH